MALVAEPIGLLLFWRLQGILIKGLADETINYIYTIIRLLKPCRRRRGLFTACRVFNHSLRTLEKGQSSLCEFRTGQSFWGWEPS